MFSAPATSIVNQLFAAVEKIPLLCFFQPFSQLGHSYFQISLHSFCCASGTRQEDLLGIPLLLQHLQTSLHLSSTFFRRA